MLSKDLFKNIVRDTCLIAIDFIIRDRQKRILLGLRKNAPAKNYWFVPGGRIFKGESLDAAVKRISESELGFVIEIQELKWLGISDHFYDDNVFGDRDFGTHYVVIAVEYTGSMSFDTESPKDAQHTGFKFLEMTELLKDPTVHEYSKRYFLNSTDQKYYRFNFLT